MANVSKPARMRSERVVVETEPAVIPYGNAVGHVTDKILRRLWSDGTEDFACTAEDCNFASERYSPVMAHRSKHRGMPRRHKDPTDAHGLIDRIEQDVAKLREIVNTGVVGTWKMRALEAERKLASIKRGLE